jgi:predicted ester cyclase
MMILPQKSSQSLHSYQAQKGGSKMNTKDFAEKFIKAENEAFQKGNFDALKALEDPNVVYHMSSFGDMVGHEAHKQQIMAVPQWFSDIKQEWRYLTGEGNLFALSYKARYISKGNIPGLPPAGKEASRDALFLFRVKHGKVVEVWNNGSWKDIDIEAALKASKK